MHVMTDTRTNIPRDEKHEISAECKGGWGMDMSVECLKHIILHGHDMLDLKEPGAQINETGYA